MTAGAATTDRIGVWCGWVLVAAAPLIPLTAWLSPLGFAPLLGLVGLACLPALRVTDGDRPLAAVLLVGLIWAAVSTAWSPFRPDDLEGNTALKLAVQLPLYWAAWCGARRADPGLRRLALRILAWGFAIYGAMFLIEAMTGGAIYLAIREAIGDPIRADLGRKNLAHSSFVLALLWPVVAAGGVRAGAPAWLAAPMIAGAAVLAWSFLSDAPVLAVILSVVTALAVWTWPRRGPQVLGAAVAAQLLLMPAFVLAGRLSGLTWNAPPSWAQRLEFWGAATDLLSEHPLRGWGLDASRNFSPIIQLHPHDASLQLWLELGPLGVAAAASAWLLILRGLARDKPDLAATATAASAVVYVLFAAINFGVWQDWWLAAGALVAVIAALMDRLPASTEPRSVVAKPSTRAASLR